MAKSKQKSSFKEKIVWIILLLVFIASTLRLWQSEWKPQSSTELKFSLANLSFSHTLDTESLPFVGSAAFDVDGDGVDEVFIGGGREQSDTMLKYRNGHFTPMDKQVLKDSHDATHGAAHLDVDNDGDIDLFTARESGVWLHLNTNKNSGGFESKKIFTPPAKDKTTPLSIALGDINKDGWVDLYISGYIKNDFVEGTTNFSDGYGGYSYLLLNNGDNTWHDATQEAGLRRQHNTFTASFVDLDNDYDSDLVIAQDTGLIEMHENLGHFPMRKISNPSVNSYPMGLAIGDYNNDGLVDIYTSNVGHTLPAFMLSSNVPEGEKFNPDYYLLRNDGDLKFTDVAREAGVGRLGFGWGTVFADLNMDGNLDLLAAQNYVKMPLPLRMVTYAGKVMENTGNGHFKLVGKSSGARNKAFGISPLVADYNGDGWPDIIWININSPSKAYMNAGNGERGNTLRLPDTVHYLNALISTPTADNEIIFRQVIAGQGLGSDPTRTLFLPPFHSSNASGTEIIRQDGNTEEGQ